MVTVQLTKLEIQSIILDFEVNISERNLLAIKGEMSRDAVDAINDADKSTINKLKSAMEQS